MDDEFEEEDLNKKGEKKAFWVGLAALLVLILVIVSMVFILRGCSGSKEEIKEAKNPAESNQVQTPAATPAQANVAGASTQPEATTAVKNQTYKVESGDTLYEIGVKFKVDWKKIAETNNIDNAGALKVGQEIIIPSE